VGCLAPLDLQAGDRGAVGRRDLAEPVAEVADADTEDGVAGRQEADHGGFEPAGARGRQDEHVLTGAEGRAHAGADTADERLELRAAVVDHLEASGLADGLGQWRRAGDAQVLGRHWTGPPAVAGVGGSGRRFAVV
jgi:hypothetical protein